MRLVELAVNPVDHLLVVVALRPPPDGVAAARAQFGVEEQLGEPLRGGGRIGERGDEAARAERRILVGAPLDDVAAGADVGGDARHARGARLEQHQRLRLADAGERDRVHLAEVIVQLHPSGELEGVVQPEMGHHVLALVEVDRVLIGRPEQEHAHARHQVAQDGGGADVGLHVLDRHRSPDEGDGRAARRGVPRDGRQAVVVDPVRDDRPAGPPARRRAAAGPGCRCRGW